MKPIRRILVPIDFSPHSAEAVAWAADLGRRYDAALELVHVHPPLSVALPEGYILQSPDQLARLLGQIDAALDEQKAFLEREAPGIPVATRILQGTPFVEIVRYARETDADLIVMGSHGRTGLAHALLGSVAEKVVRKAHCPVLTVRLEGHTFEHP
jgi:nucleotide-binding universal stress UspA family protein